MNYHNIVFTATFLLCLLTSGCWSCGPGRGGGRRRPSRELTPLLYKQCIPNVSENTLGASGPNEKKITREDDEFKDLQTVYNADIMFKDEEGTGADRLMTQRCKDRLNSLAISVMNQWPGVKLRVTEGWDEDGHHAPNSLHYEGRAVDITTNDRDRTKYGMLARLAVEAGFDWVFYQSRAHVHCSVKAESSLAAKSGSCFPGDATVTLENGLTKSLDQLTIGEKVMAVNEDGTIVYSDVIMMMDSKPNRRQRFHVIETEDGQKLTLTPQHLVYASRSNVTFDPGSVSPVYAADVELGHYVYTSHDRGRYSSIKPAKVITISSVENVGVYAPLTREGTIIINNIVASCYAMVNHNIAQFAFGPIRFLHDVSSHIWRMVATTSTEGVHWYPYLLYTFAGPFLSEHLVHADGISV